MHESLSESDDLFKISAAEVLVAARLVQLNECRKKGHVDFEEELEPSQHRVVKQKSSVCRRK